MVEYICRCINIHLNTIAEADSNDQEGTYVHMYVRCKYKFRPSMNFDMQNSDPRSVQQNSSLPVYTQNCNLGVFAGGTAILITLIF